MSDAERPNVTPLRPAPADQPRRRMRVKKRRLALILIPLGLLATISTVFGMMMAVAADLPDLENEPQYRNDTSRNSTLFDVRGKFLGRLAANTNRIFVKYDDISPYMRRAIIAIEDERYDTNNGVDLRAIGRAFYQDVVKQRAVQGGSTITQQFVKNALEAQDQRTVFQKLRESALAYHLTRKWGKRKILQEYLNTIYFGNGAYGIEAAAQTYFGAEPDHEGCGTIRRPCAAELKPHEAALLAGVVASPSGYDPTVRYRAAESRRNVVLAKMLQQGALTRAEHDTALGEALPGAVRPPQVDAKGSSAYFLTWVRQQLVDRYGAQRAFEGGLKVRTTLDSELQDAAAQSVKNFLAAPGGPTAAVVAIDNDSGEVRAMVSGTREYTERPFNLATQGQRQPGSSIKPFILAEALRQGIGPGSVWPSRKRFFCVTRKKGGGCSEQFQVNNFEGTYVGQRTLANALTYSDNAVYAAAGIKVGTKKVSRLVRRMGVRTPVSTNLAMTLGGLEEGVTPLDMAHAYETFQTGGKRVFGTLGASDQGPVGIAEVDVPGGRTIKNRTRTRRVLPAGVAQSATQVMSTVVAQGTGKRAAIGQFAAGKTGTTENSGDAWFVGFTDRLTVAVWVGYPDTLKAMETEFQGGPVEGGTFPALIWRDFMLKANAVLDTRKAKERGEKGLPPQTGPTGSTATLPETAIPAEGSAGSDATDVAPEGGGTRDGGDGAATPSNSARQPSSPAAEPVEPVEPAPDPGPAQAAPTPATPPTQDPAAGGSAAPPG